jgi:DNA polymerase-1
MPRTPLEQRSWPTAPITELVRAANQAGVALRLQGEALEVVDVGRLPPGLLTVLQDRFDELWLYLGGVLRDQPALDLFSMFGVTLIIPDTVDEAKAALAQITADSAVQTPSELHHRPRLVGLDIETAVLPGTERWPSIKLRLDGVPAKRQPDFKSIAALDPHRSRIRLVQLYGGGRHCVVLDTDKVPLDLVAPLLQQHTAIVHNAGFELRHLAAAGIDVPFFEDTLQASGLLLGAYRRGLDVAASAYLGIDLPKGLQRSDWSAPYLSQGQYCYAAIDAIVTFRLWLKLRAELLDKQRGPAYLLQRDVTPAVVHMTSRGMLVDRTMHDEQVRAWSAALAQAREAFVADSGRPPPATPNMVRAYLAEALPAQLLEGWPRTRKGLLSIRAAQLQRIAHLPAIRALLAITSMEKLLSVFGAELINKISSVTGRLHPSYNIAAAKTGRASSSNPNVQQLPKHRAPQFRQCIVAADGAVLVIGDYSMMELRGAACISGDAAMTADFANGVDLHRRQAAEMLDIPYDQVDAAARDRAKPVNFSMIYGTGAAGLAATAWNNYGVVLTLPEAEHARGRWLQRYAGYADWMKLNYLRCTQRGLIPVGRLGRVIEAAWESKTGSTAAPVRGWGDDYDADDQDDVDDGSEIYGNGAGFAQDSLKYTLCCNAPSQGACADCAMLALQLCDTALRAANIAGGPVLFVHDEIVLEVPQDQAAEACRILTETMVSAFAETFPGAPLDGVVTTRTGHSWGEVKP